MDLQQYLHAVRTYWWAVALPVVIAVSFGLYSASQAEPEYRASVTFFVATSSETDAQAAVQGDEFAQRRVNSYVELLSTDRLAGKVIEASGLDLTPGQVRAMISASSDVDTVLLTATITQSSRELVSRVGQAVATEFVELVDEVENQGSGPTSVNLEVVSGPDVSVLPPRRALAVGVPGMLGVVAGLGLAWLLELRDKTIRSEAQLGALHPVPVLGMIPLDRRLRDAPRQRQLPASTGGTESFRQLRTNLEFIDVGTPLQIIVVTSSVAAEGKTTTVTNLGAALVAAGKRVVIVEADLRRPSLNGYFGASRSLGLTDVVVGRADVDDALQPVGFNGLTLLPSGPLPPNPSELVGTDAMVDLLESLRDRFDSIIIDTPPLLPVTDAAVLAAHADGVLVVARAGKTTRHQLMMAMRSLQAVGARVLGTVLNIAPSRRGSAYTSYWRTGAAGPAAEPPVAEGEPPVDPHVGDGGDGSRNGAPLHAARHVPPAYRDEPR
jgi:capsular exopolysaccharide synthesis family protein